MKTIRLDLIEAAGFWSEMDAGNHDDELLTAWGRTLPDPTTTDTFVDAEVTRMMDEGTFDAFCEAATEKVGAQLRGELEPDPKDEIEIDVDEGMQARLHEWCLI